MKQKLKTAVQFLLNPRFLFCFGLAWMLTNGWSYVMFALGTWWKSSWMMAVSGTYMALLWFPFTPEKLITVIIAMGLLRWLFPNDQKTLGILRDMNARICRSIKQRRNKRHQNRKSRQKSLQTHSAESANPKQQFETEKKD